MPMGFFLANANMHGCLHHHSHLQWGRDNWYQQLGEFRCNGMETTGAGRVVVAAHVDVVAVAVFADGVAALVDFVSCLSMQYSCFVINVKNNKNHKCRDPSKKKVYNQMCNCC